MKLSLIGLIILSIITTVTVSKSATVTVAWDPNCNTNVVRYKVYYGNTNGIPLSTNVVQAGLDDCGGIQATSTNIYFGIYTNSVTANGRMNTTLTVSNLNVGTVYAFALVSVGSVSPNTNILESDFTKELIYQVPSSTNIYVPPAPTGFKIQNVGP